MYRRQKWIIFFTAFILLTDGIFFLAFADHKDHDNYHKKGEDHKHSKNYKKQYINPVTNQTYQEKCGMCHFVYQPELLPSGSWEKVLAQLENHHGKKIKFDSESIKTISEYLKTNAAEYSSAKRAIKIMKSLDGKTPTRITDIPYIQKKHVEISPVVLKKGSIGSQSNCIACHKTADKGIYEEDSVEIPQ
ncbi:MAG: cytochrome C [Thermodesulfobacteriota bacterium]|nr:cytochrome C [Thermodesulfobacteriota bacterium]